MAEDAGSASTSASGQNADGTSSLMADQASDSANIANASGESAEKDNDTSMETCL